MYKRFQLHCEYKSGVNVTIDNTMYGPTSSDNLDDLLRPATEWSKYKSIASVYVIETPPPTTTIRHNFTPPVTATFNKVD